MVVVNNLDLSKKIEAARIVAILRGSDVDATVTTAKALFDAGIKILEVTLTLERAASAIEQISSFTPEDCLVGAGTVLTEGQVDQALNSGAQFIVTPSLSPSVQYSLKMGVGILAGVFSPTEIQRGMDEGVAAVKLFPASVLGPGYVKAVLDPFPKARIIPVGGMTLEAIPEYFRAGAFAAGVGGPLIGNATNAGGSQEGLISRTQDFLKLVSRF
jgi:2-dehydro-3-deoxyphosphogluconate aldolase/(4S)-4-hydroxy-2-oxoglutarate aldolase